MSGKPTLPHPNPSMIRKEVPNLYYSNNLFILMKKSFLGGLLVFILIFQPVSANTTATNQASLLDELKSKLEQLLALIQEPLEEAPAASLAGATVTSGTGVGQRAQLNTSLSTFSIRASVGSGAKVIGSQPKGTIGTVTHQRTQTITSYPVGCSTQIPTVLLAVTCTPKYTVIDWLRVNFDTGVDGWVEKKYLIPAASTKFNIDTPLVVSTQTTVRSSPNGSSVGTQKAGSVGVVKGSPVSSGGKTWWPVNYKSGVDGWTDASAIKNLGVELPNRNLSVIEIPTPVPTSLTALQPYADLAGIDVNTLKDVTNVIKEGSYNVVSDNGTVAIVELTPKGATELGLNQGAMFMFGADDEGNFEVAVIDPLNTAIAMRVNENDPYTETWTIRDETTGYDGQVVINYVDVGYGDIYITASQLNADGSLDIIGISEPIGQLDASNMVWKMPDVCSGGCVDMTEWGATAEESSDGESVNTTTGSGSRSYSSGEGAGMYEGPPAWQQWCTVNECPPPGYPGHEEKYGSAMGFVSSIAFQQFETMGL
jgi:hypothetical protein